jgi:uncharacterized protein (TIGR00730 family)
MNTIHDDTLGEGQRKALIETIKADPSYRLAFNDEELLMKEELRPLRLQLEFAKPELYLRYHNIKSTIVLFGSTRIHPPAEAQKRLEKLLDEHPNPTDGDAFDQAIKKARRQVELSRYYDESRRFAQLITQRFQQEHRRDFVIITGGGPGIMEAANRGAKDVGGLSVGLNILLPHEQEPNPFITPGLCFQFHYFALRKMHFMLRAEALVAFPGGYGTIDELFEALTLIQTRKMVKIPIILIGQSFWQRAINFSFLVDEGVIAEEDLKLFKIADRAEDAIDILHDFYKVLP